MNRRNFLSTLGMTTAGIALMPSALKANGIVAPFTFEISLAEFSYASELFSNKMTNFDFPQRAVDNGINVVEWVSGFFNSKHTDKAYMNELKSMCDDLGVKSNLIMVDGENIASVDAAKRQHAVESHYPWVDAAKFLGCTSIRVNLGDAMAAMTGKGKRVQHLTRRRLRLMVMESCSSMPRKPACM
ncbi:MAG: hypothetical protein WDO15_25020 [Bacteroidota bacterium]